MVANSFLANTTTSATFATILVEYLLARLDEMGCKYNRCFIFLYDENVNYCLMKLLHVSLYMWSLITILSNLNRHWF